MQPENVLAWRGKPTGAARSLFTDQYAGEQHTAELCLVRNAAHRAGLVPPPPDVTHRTAGTQQLATSQAPGCCHVSPQHGGHRLWSTRYAAFAALLSVVRSSLGSMLATNACKAIRVLQSMFMPGSGSAWSAGGYVGSPQVEETIYEARAPHSPRLPYMHEHVRRRADADKYTAIVYGFVDQHNFTPLHASRAPASRRRL